MSEKKIIKLEDVKQVEDGLYSFFSSININNIPWCLEYFNDSKHTALLFKSSGYTEEIEHYLGGGYRATYPFEIYIQASRKDTKARLDLSRILYALVQALAEEEAQGFPNLALDEAIPQEVTLTTLPSDYTGEEAALSTFYCSMTLTYEKKGRFE